MKVNTRDYQIILGTIMGGSSIVKSKGGKHCYLSMRDRNGKWLEHKAFQLAHYASPEPFIINKTNRWHSLCHPIFDEFKIKFYKNEKRHLEIDNLTFWDLGLAIWFGDSGKFENGSVIINTHIWGKTGTETIKKYFELCNWSAEIFKDRKYFRIKLAKEASIHFMKTINHQLPLTLEKKCNI